MHNKKNNLHITVATIYIYNLLINTRVANKRTNLGNMYLEKTYTSSTNMANAKTTWFMKKKGTNWGIQNCI